MFVQINHYFSPFVKLLSASRTNVGKIKIPTPPPNFSMLVKQETLFAEASQALTLQTSQPQRNCATYSADWGSGCSELRATECNMCGRVPGGAAVEDRKCTTGDPAKSEFLISNHFILRCSDNDALPHLTPGTNGFLHNLQWQLLKSIASAALVTLLWGRWSVAAL